MLQWAREGDGGVMKQQSRDQNSTGFSLIEIVVIMAVIGAIALLSIPTFVTFMQAQRTPGGPPVSSWPC